MISSKIKIDSDICLASIYLKIIIKSVFFPNGRRNIYGRHKFYLFNDEVNIYYSNVRQRQVLEKEIPTPHQFFSNILREIVVENYELFQVKYNNNNLYQNFLVHNRCFVASSVNTERRFPLP